MLDSNKEVPIRLKGNISSSNLIGDTSSLSMSNNSGMDFIGNYGSTSINKKSSYITKTNSQRVNVVEGWVWTGTLPSATESYIKKEVEIFEENLPWAIP